MGLGFSFQFYFTVSKVLFLRMKVSMYYLRTEISSGTKKAIN